jgi:hypothetical protein
MIDDSVRNLSQQIANLPINSKPMIIKQLSKKYEIQSSEKKDAIALKPLSLNMEEK